MSWWASLCLVGSLFFFSESISFFKKKERKKGGVCTFNFSFLSASRCATSLSFFFPLIRTERPHKVSKEAFSLYFSPPPQCIKLN